jgi:hypothetical protein
MWGAARCFQTMGSLCDNLWVQNGNLVAISKHQISGFDVARGHSAPHLKEERAVQARWRSLCRANSAPGRRQMPHKQALHSPSAGFASANQISISLGTPLPPREGGIYVDEGEYAPDFRPSETLPNKCFKLWGAIGRA